MILDKGAYLGLHLTLSKFIQVNLPQCLHVDKALELITKGNEEMTHGVPLETVISKIISSATQNLPIFNALFQYIHIETYRGDNACALSSPLNC